ncbi:small secreted protein [Streptomyces sp. ODS28]|uniref:small secreted protein n=1 Tax=Streptomyces sp. ODS28 TaxID=3136688 RepID=UPI0031ED5CD1
MNKKLAAALSGSAVLVLALSGCGDDSAEKTDAWAKKVCDQVGPQVTKINKANSEMDAASKDKKKSAKEVQKTDSTAFGHIAGAYNALGNAVNKAGAPPVDDGAKLQKDAVKELKTLSAKYRGLKKQVDGLDAKDSAKFAKGLRGLAPKLDELGKSGDKALQKLQSGDVGKAMANQDGCKRPSSAATPSS